MGRQMLYPSPPPLLSPSLYQMRRKSTTAGSTGQPRRQAGAWQQLVSRHCRETEHPSRPFRTHPGQPAPLASPPRLPGPPEGVTRRDTVSVRSSLLEVVKLWNISDGFFCCLATMPAWRDDAPC